jgi:hypothetical protein
MPQLERESEIRSRVSDLKSSHTVKIIASFELHLFDAINVEASYPRPPATRIDCGHALPLGPLLLQTASPATSIVEPTPAAVESDRLAACIDRRSHSYSLREDCRSDDIGA